MGFDSQLKMKKNVEQKDVVDIIEVKYLNVNVSVYIRYIIFLLCIFCIKVILCYFIFRM